MAIYTEVETGQGSDALDRRPQLAVALKEARRQRCSIAVAKLDRLSRDVHFISGLMAHRVAFLVADLAPTLTLDRLANGAVAGLGLTLRTACKLSGQPFAAEGPAPGPEKAAGSFWSLTARAPPPPSRRGAD
jgi:hypothetical protein